MLTTTHCPKGVLGVTANPTVLNVTIESRAFPERQIWFDEFIELRNEVPIASSELSSVAATVLS